MTAPTPEQMRALADGVSGYHPSLETRRNTATALRATADEADRLRAVDDLGMNRIVKAAANEWFDELTPAGVSMDTLNLLVHMITERLATDD